MCRTQISVFFTRVLRIDSEPNIMSARTIGWFGKIGPSFKEKPYQFAVTLYFLES